jgi:hypothetical protein
MKLFALLAQIWAAQVGRRSTAILARDAQPAAVAPVAPAPPPPRVQAGLTVPNLQISGGDARLQIGTDSPYTVGMCQSESLCINSPTGELLNMNNGSINSQVPVTTSHVDVGALRVGGVPQYTLVIADDFAAGATGWSHPDVTTCGGVSMLGGYCKFAQGEVERDVSSLPSHSQLRVMATFHFIDRWVGETAFMKINIGEGGAMVPVWTDSHAEDHEVHGLNVCGSESVHEGKFAVSIDVSVPHSASDAKIAFGSTMDAQDPCDESWGISNFEVYVRG